ncbi:hypothetical protein [Amycolatopsis sp. MtRt-6]|uniref:hypothetical protein n=1 Tax=Amycolatopsis sp. MtRt-6 TaxID=2792782 RepID=UPI001A8CB33E|nr:hypothetical protein [Amycolatopsis sp. MtRt-6]
MVSTIGVDLPAVLGGRRPAAAAPLLDLTERSRALVEGLGEAVSWPLYLTLARFLRLTDG